MSDSELLDALEREMLDRPIVLWDGVGEFPGRECRLRGLSTLNGGRSLRDAIRDAFGRNPQMATPVPEPHAGGNG